MLCGFLSPEGTLFCCPSYGHTRLAEKLVTEFNIKRTREFDICEDALLKNGWICIRVSNVYKAVYDDNRKVIPITDEQKEFLAKHRGEFFDRQLAYIEDLLHDF